MRSRGGAGIGLRGSLKICCPQGHVGSNPTRRTSLERSAAGLSSAPSRPDQLHRRSGSWARLRVPAGRVPGGRNAVSRPSERLASPHLHGQQVPGDHRKLPRAVRDVTGRNAGLVPKIGYVEISSYWKHWLCVFPQHGAGRKHLRHIALEGWQASLVRRHPEGFIRGLIHSDGCRVINRVKSYAYPRYFFSDRSADLRELFVWACALIGVDARPSNRYNISVAKRRSVEILDRFIGPKR